VRLRSPPLERHKQQQHYDGRRVTRGGLSLMRAIKSMAASDVESSLQCKSYELPLAVFKSKNKHKALVLSGLVRFPGENVGILGSIVAEFGVAG
jgi:hypothetical protein